jgi:hypothetical protein
VFESAQLDRMRLPVAFLELLAHVSRSPGKHIADDTIFYHDADGRLGACGVVEMLCRHPLQSAQFHSVSLFVEAPAGCMGKHQARLGQATSEKK